MTSEHVHSGRVRTALVSAITAATLIIISFAALEVLVRAYIFDPSVPYIRTPGWRMIVHHNNLLPGVTEDHVIEINRLGLRGALPIGNSKPLIAVLGGSTVEDWVLPEKKTWVKQFQQNLQTCSPQAFAANLGKSGVNARHHLLQLPETAGYMPQFDAYVVLMGLNDFLFDLRIHHPFNLPANWWRSQAFMSDRYQEGRFAVTALLKRLYRIYFGSRDHILLPVSDFGVYQDSLRKAHRNVKKEQWVDELPDLTAHLRTYRETIRALKAFADTKGKPIIFVTQPFVWSATMTSETLSQIYAGFIGGDMLSDATKWYTPSALEKGLTAYNDALLATCESDKLICVDAARQLPHEAKYFYDDFHFSPTGAKMLGEVVADKVKSLFCANAKS